MIATPSEMGLQPDAKGQIAVIIFDSELTPFNESPELTQKLVLEHGGLLEYFVMEKRQTLHHGAHFFGVR